MTESIKSKITVMGLGGAGVRAIGALSRSAGPELRLLAIDTDRQALNACPIAEENKLLAAAAWRGGRGCGGNLVDGHRALARERAEIEEKIAGSQLLLVVGGLGGGTASGGAGVILSVSRKLDIPTVFLLTLPFTLEGHSKRKAAEEALREDLLEMADAVVTLPNDLLFSVLPATTPLAEAFELADREISGAVLGLAAVICDGNLLSTNFADLAATLRRKKSFCSIGLGSATAEESADGVSRTNLALERMLLSPLLGGADKLKEADTVIFSLIGGPDLAIGETRQVLEQAVDFIGPDTRVLSGAATRPDFGGRVQFAALTIRFDIIDEAESAAEPRPGARAIHKNKPSVEVEQLSFSLDMLSKGVMDKTTPVIFQGEDLDFPTFQRRNIAIDTGKAVSAAELNQKSTGN